MFTAFASSGSSLCSGAGLCSGSGAGSGARARGSGEAPRGEARAPVPARRSSRSGAGAAKPALGRAAKLARCPGYCEGGVAVRARSARGGNAG